MELALCRWTQSLVEASSMADNETPEVPEKPSAIKKLLVPGGMALVLVAAIIGGLHFTGMVQFGKPRLLTTVFSKLFQA